MVHALMVQSSESVTLTETGGADRRGTILSRYCRTVEACLLYMYIAEARRRSARGVVRAVSRQQLRDEIESSQLMVAPLCLVSFETLLDQPTAPSIFITAHASERRYSTMCGELWSYDTSITNMC